MPSGSASASASVSLSDDSLLEVSLSLNVTLPTRSASVSASSAAAAAAAAASPATGTVFGRPVRVARIDALSTYPTTETESQYIARTEDYLPNINNPYIEAEPITEAPGFRPAGL
jgi:hypothetical protein